MRANTAEQWLQQRVNKYGSIPKLNLFGKPTVFIYGQAANKFMFTDDGSTVANQQTQSIRMILGDRKLMELNGEDHKRVKRAIMLFLKPESLKRYVGKIDEELRMHIQMYWDGKQQVKVLRRHYMELNGLSAPMGVNLNVNRRGFTPRGFGKF